MAERDPYVWMDVFGALDWADRLDRRDYDFNAEVDQMRHDMRQRYEHENACLRAQNEHYVRLISDAAGLQMPPMFIRGDDIKLPG